MDRKEQPVRFAGTTLGRHRHICALFHTPEEEYRVLLPFIRQGIERGEKAFHIVDSHLQEEHYGRLEAGGIDTAAEEKDGLLEVRCWHDSYLQGGHFDQNRMLSLIEEVLTEGQAQGYRLTRIVAQMEWALEDMPGVNDLVEYETRLNHVLPKYRDAAICAYDCAKFGAGVLMDILRTHPSVIIGGVLQNNPFFVPPSKFLRELRERGAYRTRVAC